MTRNPLLHTLTAGLLFTFLSGCAGAPIVTGDGKIEKPLEQVTGLTSADVEKASQKSELNLWDVYALAVEHTEDLASQYESIEQAGAQSQQAVASILPQIYLNGTKGWNSNNTAGVGGAISGASVPSDTLYLSGAETIFTGLTQVAAIKGSQAQLDENHHLFQQEARNLLLSVARAYYTVLQSRDTQQSKQEILKLTEEILKQEQQWKAIGRSRESDVLTTEAQLAQLKGDLEAIHGQLSRAQDSLSLLTSLKSSQPLKAEEQPIPPVYTMQDALAKVDGRSDVLAAKAAVDLADASLLQAHGQHLPSLAVQGKYFLDSNGASTSDWNLQLVASLPLFEGGAVLAQERSAASKKRQSELQYSFTRRQAVIDVQGSYSAFATSMREVDAYGKALEAAQKDYAAVVKDRKLALNTNLDVLQSLTQLQNAQNNYNQAHYQTLINWIWLGTATGELPKLQTADKN